MRPVIAFILVFVLGVMFFGCAPDGGKESLRPAPSSSFSRADWTPVIKAWVDAKPGNTWAPVKSTGSMAPYMDSTSILLIEKIANTNDLKPGRDVGHYIRADGTRVVHTVREVNERGAVLFSGDNNDGLNADGWIPAERVWGRTAAVLNTNGQ